MPDIYRGTTWPERTVMAVLTAVAVSGLAIDAYVHLDIAASFDPVRTRWISQGELFRVEAALSILAALALALRPRRYTAAFAVLVAAGGVFAVLLYQYVEVGKIGPIPDMYDPLWTTEKVVSLVGEAVAGLAAFVVLAVIDRRIRRAKRTVAASPVPRAASISR